MLSGVIAKEEKIPGTCATDQKPSSGDRRGCVRDYCPQKTSEMELSTDASLQDANTSCPQNRMSRLQFVKKNLNEPAEFWKKDSRFTSGLDIHGHWYWFTSLHTSLQHNSATTV